MSLYNKIIRIYPELTDQTIWDNRKIVLMDDGYGPYIKVWDVPLEQPSEELLAITEPYYPEQLEELKLQLSSTDYKIIKCYEYQLAGKELPYNVISLHMERQALREKINEINK